ncbi:MAG: LysM peptidoglycan-binding domain-containing protein [Elusimicrobiales bacterium]|nr:LysM peptidoglycan-binding domain-containing protein [Elusimicrobiales bacterium]
MKKLLSALLVLTFLSSPSGAEELQTIVVKPGDTLWSIANTYLKDPKRWNEILRYNKLPSADPSIALPGMPLKIPVRLIKEQFRAAKLVYHINEVLFRPVGGARWDGVKTNMDLYRSDTLRTTVNARADVKFYTGEILNLMPNSMAVLRPPRKDADVQLLSGEMRGVRSRVVTASARIIPRTKDTEFGARIKEDLTTLVQVYKGRAAVEAQGKVVEVSEGFASEVKMDMPPSKPVKLPALPEFSDGGTRLARASQPKVKMSGSVISLDAGKAPRAGSGASAPKAGEGAPKPGDASAIDANEISKMITVANPVQGYHIQASRDRTFSKIDLDRTYEVFDRIDLSNYLPAGTYWVRISYIDLLGFEGKFNAPRQVTIAK